MRVGQGYDLHRLVEGRKFILGGLEIPFDKGLLGHSDADVLCHAIIDALLGAAGLGDIGELFPDTDSQYKDASSIKLLQYVGDKIHESGFSVNNIDATVVAEAPKLAPYKVSIVENIADALKLNHSAVSVKAKTNEGMDATGRGEAVSAYAVALLLPLEL